MSTTEAQTVGEDDLALLPPVVYGFSLALKSWGMMVRWIADCVGRAARCGVFATVARCQGRRRLTRCAQTVEEFEPVTFDSAAWGHLVLESASKELLRALVEAQNASTDVESLLVSDVITNKGTGTVIVVRRRHRLA